MIYKFNLDLINRIFILQYRQYLSGEVVTIKQILITCLAPKSKEYFFNGEQTTVNLIEVYNFSVINEQTRRDKRQLTSE